MGSVARVTRAKTTRWTQAPSRLRCKEKDEVKGGRTPPLPSPPAPAPASVPPRSSLRRATCSTARARRRGTNFEQVIIKAFCIRIGGNE